jgi:hypothetical protein
VPPRNTPKHAADSIADAAFRQRPLQGFQGRIFVLTVANTFCLTTEFTLSCCSEGVNRQHSSSISETRNAVNRHRLIGGRRDENLRLQRAAQYDVYRQ